MGTESIGYLIAALGCLGLRVHGGSIEWVSAPDAFGWPREALLGSALSLLWHPDDLELAGAVRQAACTGRSSTDQLRILTKSGETRWVQFTALAEDDTSFVAILRDITDQVRLQDRAQGAEDELQLVAGHSHEVLCTIGSDDRVTWASASVSRLLGWLPTELIGTVLADLIHPDDRAPAVSGDDAVSTDALVGDRTGSSGLRPDPAAHEPSRSLVRMRTRAGAYRWMARLPPGHWHGKAVSGYQDVDDLIRSREELQRDATRLRLILEALPDPHLVLSPVRDGSGAVLDLVVDIANQRAADFVGRSRDDLIGGRLADVFPGSATSGLLVALIDQLDHGHGPALDDWVELPPSGGERRLEFRAARADGSLSLTWRDVTDVRQHLAALAGSEIRYRLLAENSSDAVVWMRNAVVEWASPSLTPMLGWLPAEWIGRRLDDFVHVEDVADYLPIRDVATSNGRDRSVMAISRFRVRSQNLSYHWVEAHARPYVDAEGNVDGVAASMHVIDNEVEAYRELDRRARFDELTGLLNRKEALEQISNMGQRSRRSGPDTGVLFCDVDRFKEINDRLGHAAGDAVLRTLASRIGDCVRSGDVTARVGGDEMLVVLDGVHGIADALDIAEKIRIATSMPIDLPAAGVLIGEATGHVSTTMSIGVTLTCDGESVDQLIARADRAMYQAKRTGTNRVIALTDLMEPAC